MRTASHRLARPTPVARLAMLAALVLQACGPEPTAIERACDGEDVFDSLECQTAVSEHCRALSSMGDCQATEPFDANGVELFCQWTRVAPLTDEVTCSFGPSFGRCEAGFCVGFCDGAVPDACTDEGALIANNHFVFVQDKEMVDLVGSGDGRVSSPIGPWSAIDPSADVTTGWCATGAQPAGPSWCSCGAQACAAVAQ